MSIELKNVTYTYSPGTAYEIHALKDINLSIPDGQFIGIIGHTGRNLLFCSCSGCTCFCKGGRSGKSRTDSVYSGSYEAYE